MLKPRYESNWIYWLFILYISTSIVLAKGISDCDVDDLECLEDYTTATKSFVTSSSFSFGEPSSTVTATSTDILSDFHEAKLVKPKPHNPNIPNRPNISNPVPPDQSVQDNVNQDQDVGSSINESINEEKQLSALSNVEAGILSACGVLVVAGIAVGIFVWKNTTRRRNLRRNHDMPMVDIENGDNDDNDGGNVKLGALNGKEIYETSLSQTKDGKLQATLTLPPTQHNNNDFFSNWQRRNQDHDTHFEIEPKQKLHDIEVISENKITTTTATTTILPSLDDDTSEHVMIEQTITKKIVVDQVDFQLKKENDDAMFAEPPNIEANTTVTTTRPSALDPAYDPTALTYPLQKFLQTPILYTSSPMQISIHLGSDDEEEENNKIYQPTQATHTETSPQIGESSTNPSPQLNDESSINISPQLVGESSVDHKGIMGTPLSQHLNKLLRYPSTDRQRMISSSSSKMVDIDLQDNNTPEILIHASPRLNHVLGKFAKEPLPVFDKQDSFEKGKGPAQLFIDDYKKKYLEEHGKPFMSPLDLPDDQFVPLQDAVGPPLISRAKVLADPIRRLGEDEIALWEQSCKKKKEPNNEMLWDERLLRQQVEHYDRKNIARFYYGAGDATVPIQQQQEKEGE